MHVKPDQASPDGPAAAELDELIGSDCPLCGERICCDYGWLPILGGGGRGASAAKRALLLDHCSSGELMLKSLGQPFLTDGDANEAQVWQLWCLYGMFFSCKPDSVHAAFKKCLQKCVSMEQFAHTQRYQHLNSIKIPHATASCMRVWPCRVITDHVSGQFLRVSQRESR